MTDDDESLKRLLRNKFPNYDLYLFRPYLTTEEEVAQWEAYKRGNAYDTIEEIVARRRELPEAEANPGSEPYQVREPVTPEQKFLAAPTDEQALAAALEMKKRDLAALCVRLRGEVFDLRDMEGDSNTAKREFAERIFNTAEAARRRAKLARKKSTNYSEKWQTFADDQAAEIWLKSDTKNYWLPEKAAKYIILEMDGQNAARKFALRAYNYGKQELKEKLPFPKVPKQSTLRKYLESLRIKHLDERTRRANPS